MDRNERHGALLYVGVIVRARACTARRSAAWRRPAAGALQPRQAAVDHLLTTLGNGLLNGMLAPLLA